MLRGESVLIRSKRFTVKTVRSCPTDPDRYLVRARPAFPVSRDAVSALATRFRGEHSAELNATRFRIGALRILVLADGAIVVRRASTQNEAISAVREVVAALAELP